MMLRTRTLSAALALAICGGGAALAQQAVTIEPVPQDAQGAATQPPASGSAASEPAAPEPAGPTTDGPVAAGSGETPSGESATAPTQSSEPTSVPGVSGQTPMEAPSAPTATADTAAPAPDAAADAAADPAADAAAAETADAATDEAATAGAEPAGAGAPAGDAVAVTEGDEAAAPVETTGAVVAEEGHDDIEGAGAGDHAAEDDHGGGDHGAAHIEDVAFSFEGPFGAYDQFQLQRGLQIYTEVCAACHGMKFVPIRTLHDDGGPGLPENQVRAYAANLTPILDTDTGEERPRLPTDHFPTVVGEGMGPDLSLMAKARAGFHGPYGTGISQLVNGIGGPEYIHALLTGYTGEEVEQAGSVLYENTAFPGGLISMPNPLSDDLVTYEDGTPATVDQMAMDVAAFMMWTAEPKMTDRKHVGLVAVLLLIVLTSLLYLTNKRLWAPHKNKLPRTP